MRSTQDLFIQEDLLPVFDFTLNSDARAALGKIFAEPLSSLIEIQSRQEILKYLLSISNLFTEYEYHKIDYWDTFKFLNHFPADNLKAEDYLTYLVRKKKNQIVVGQHIQMVYFLRDLELVFKKYFQVENIPKHYQEDIQFIFNYLLSFKLSKFKDSIQKNKFGFKSVQYLNKMLLYKRKSGDTALFYEKLNILEAYISISKTILKKDFHFPKVGEEQLSIQEMYHPFLSNPIKNSIDLVDNIILITGANMSGKSTFLKTISLIVYLGHLGLPVPALNASMPFFDHISVQINHSDDLKNGYSHFMQEIINLKEVLLKAKDGKACFAVFDELFKGTNYEDALQISLDTVAGLKQFDSSTFLISTHISELQHKSASLSEVSAYYLDCIIEEDEPIFTYTLKSGWSTIKIGQLLFEKEGLRKLLGNG